MVIKVITSSLSARLTFCLNNCWNLASVICPKMQRAQTHLQHVFWSPSRWNWVELCIKSLPNKRSKILGLLCVAAISRAGPHPMLEKYSVGCPFARELITTKCPGALTSLCVILSCRLYNTTNICAPLSASFKLLSFLRASYLVTLHHLGSSVSSIS